MAQIRQKLEITGLLGRFGEHLFSATMVARGKPAPDLLYAAQQARRNRAVPCGCVYQGAEGVRRRQSGSESLADDEPVKLACGSRQGAVLRSAWLLRALFRKERFTYGDL